jgi:hypothetical protein
MKGSPGRMALAAPGCLVTAALLAWLLLVPFDRHPMWTERDLNLSEAAAVRDLGEIVRLIDASEDPDAVRDVRSGYLADTTVRLTPLEAAVASKDVESVRILLLNGATMTTGSWHHLRCMTESDEVGGYLDRIRPAGASAGCHPSHPAPSEATHP